MYDDINNSPASLKHIPDKVEKSDDSSPKESLKLQQSSLQDL